MRRPPWVDRARRSRARPAALAAIVLPAAMAAIVFSASFAAAKEAAQRQQAVGLVQEVLQREIDGRSDEREDLLAKAVLAAPDYAPARWHRGEIELDGSWRDLSSATAMLKSDLRLEKYRFLRARHPDTAEGHAKIAEWCGARGLVEQERAHWTRVLAFESEHPQARRELGFRRIGAEWLLAAEIEVLAEHAQAARNDFAKWRPRVEEIRDSLRRRGPVKREAARERALAIGDPAAIGALEEALSTELESEAELLVEILAGMAQREATLAIARQAVFSPFPGIRVRAAKTLSLRRDEDFVPAMLSSMFTPISSHAEVQWTPDGRLLYRQAFTREGADVTQRLVFDTLYSRRAEPGGNARETLSRAVSDAWTSSRMRKWRAEDSDRAHGELNERIAAALNAAFNQGLPPEPQAWWQWWNDRQEVFVQGEKPLQTRQVGQEVAVQDRVSDADRAAAAPVIPAPPIRRVRGGGDGGGGQRLDCLAAGTHVWTTAGATVIETIQVGDLVLSQDPNSGELAFKPVLATTVRPAGELIRIQWSEEAISTSGGHPFWVAGEGWVKARDLRAGMVLHTASGPATITLIEPGEVSETYNLVVADFHNYFAGKQRVLSHDNTVRRPTTALVPGLFSD